MLVPKVPFELEKFTTEGVGSFELPALATLLLMDPNPKLLALGLLLKLKAGAEKLSPFSLPRLKAGLVVLLGTLKVNAEALFLEEVLVSSNPNVRLLLLSALSFPKEKLFCESVFGLFWALVLPNENTGFGGEDGLLS